MRALCVRDNLLRYDYVSGNISILHMDMKIFKLSWGIFFGGEEREGGGNCCK